MKITLACPTNRGIQPKTLDCLLNLVAQNHEWHILVAEEGYSIAENRNWVAAQALQNDSDYLLMIDDDMTFEPDILDRLIANDKDICGVAYHSRGGNKSFKYPADAIMSIAEPEKGKYIILEENTDPKYKTTFGVHATGTGIILIKTEVFKKIPQPWFMFEYHENGCCKTGEDWYFCEKAKKYGIKTFADPRPKVGHLGEAIF